MGKSAWLKREIAHDRRVVVWDMKNEYAAGAACTAVYKITDLIARLESRGSSSGRFALVSSSVSQFDLFCRVAYKWGEWGGVTVVAEELADVTSPGKAPLGWGMVLRRGREVGLTVYGVTQRPAESDKTILGNYTRIHCTRLKRAEDRVKMAREMGVSVAVLDALPPLSWIECTDAGEITTGKLTFKNPRNA